MGQGNNKTRRRFENLGELQYKNQLRFSWKLDPYIWKRLPQGPQPWPQPHPHPQPHPQPQPDPHPRHNLQHSKGQWTKHFNFHKGGR